MNTRVSSQPKKEDMMGTVEDPWHSFLFLYFASSPIPSPILWPYCQGVTCIPELVFNPMQVSTVLPYVFKIGLILFRLGWYLLCGLKLTETFLSTDITGMTLPPRMMLFKDSSLM